MWVLGVKIVGVDGKAAAEAPADAKICSRCMQAKPVTDFAKDRTKASGRKSHCRDCDNAKYRSYYARTNPSGRNREVARLRSRGQQRCLRCGDVKDLTDFPREKTTRLSGRGSFCRECANLERQERHAIVRARAIRIYGGHCAVCGSRSELEFDHIDWNGAEHRRKENHKRMIRRIARTGAPIPEYRLRLLCAGCHHARTQAFHEVLKAGPFDLDLIEQRLRELRYDAIHRC